MAKSYREPSEEEMETTVNVLYGQGYLSVCTNNVKLQRELNKILGAPTKEDKRGKSILGSTWEIPLTDKVRISRMVLKANLFDL